MSMSIGIVLRDLGEFQYWDFLNSRLGSPSEALNWRLRLPYGVTY